MELEIVVMQDLPGLHNILVLLLDESVNSGALEIISENVELVLRFYSIVEVLSDVYVFLCGRLLSALVGRDLDLVGSENLAESSRIVVEE